MSSRLDGTYAITTAFYVPNRQPLLRFCAPTSPNSEADNSRTDSQALDCQPFIAAPQHCALASLGMAITDGYGKGLIDFGA
jgi:hypothetical protein